MSWNENQRRCLVNYQLHKNPSLLFEEHYIKTFDLYLYASLSVTQTLFYKFDLVLLDNFRLNFIGAKSSYYFFVFHESFVRVNGKKLLFRLIILINSNMVWMNYAILYMLEETFGVWLRTQLIWYSMYRHVILGKIPKKY